MIAFMIILTLLIITFSFNVNILVSNFFKELSLYSLGT